MPMSNTSLDKFYSTTSAWDPWKTYKELINEETANGAKKQVIKREFNGVAQYAEERRRQTEGDKLFVVDLSKTIIKFKQAIDQARINIEDSKLNPLADLFFQFNNLMISYQNYVRERATTPSNITDIKKQFTEFIPTLKQLQAVFNTFVEQARLEGTLKNYDLVASVQFQEMLNNLENNYFNVVSLANDLSDVARQEEILRKMVEREIKTRQAEVKFQEELAQITEIQDKIDSLTAEIDQLDQKREVLLDERILYQRRSKIAKALDIELDRLDATIAKYRDEITELRKLLPGSGSSSGSGMFGKLKYGGAFSGTDMVIDNFKELIKEKLGDRANLYHILNNKNLSQDEVKIYNQKLQSINKTVAFYVEKLQTATLAELSKILQEDRSKIERVELNKEAPAGYQFVLDPISGATVLKPVNPTIPSDKQKQDIQPMINNAGQIIAAENASYASFKSGSITQDNLDVKRSSALSSLVPLLRAIVVIKQDEGSALYAGISDPEFKKSIADAVPEVTATSSFTPMPPPPPPPSPPTPPPSGNNDKKAFDDAIMEFRNTVGNAGMAMSDKSGADLEAYFDSIVPTLVKDYKIMDSSPAKDPSVNLDNLKNSMNSLGDLRQKFDNALNPPPKQMTPTEGYQAFQKLLGEARNKKSSLSTNQLNAYYTSIIPDLIKYYNLAIQIGNIVNKVSLHALMNQVDPVLTKMFDEVLTPTDYSKMTTDELEALRVVEENKLNDAYNNFQDGIIPNKTLYMSGITGVIDQLVKLTVEKFKKMSGTPTFNDVNDVDVRKILVDNYNTAKGSGKKGRGRPRKDTKAVEYEYVQADEFYKKSFSGLKDSKEGDNIYGKEVPDVLFKNPGLSRVNKYTEGSGAFFNPSVGGADLATYNNALLQRIGLGIKGKRKGHRRTKHKTDEI